MRNVAKEGNLKSRVKNIYRRTGRTVYTYGMRMRRKNTPRHSAPLRSATLEALNNQKKFPIQLFRRMGNFVIP